MKTFTPRYLWLSLCVCLFAMQSATAQTQIQGSVTDAQDSPLAYANVLLLNPVDSSLITGNITDDNGNYTFNKLPTGNYLLSFSMIGYQEQYSESFQLPANNTINIPTASLLENAAVLGEVQIVEKRALFEQKIDRLVVNVENSIALTGTSALEVLKRSPGVAVNQQNNSISMSGKDDVIVMINGKISRMPTDAVVQMLGGMSSDNIEKIELIHTPPSNYDAEGDAGFINIVLKKSQDKGFNGGFSINAGHGKKEKAGTSFNVNFRKNKVNIFGDYSWRYTNNPQFFTTHRKFENDGVVFENTGDSERDPTRTHVQNARVGVDIELGKNTILGGLFSWSDRYWEMDAINDVRSLQNGQVVTRLSIPNDEINHDQTYVGNINLQHSFSDDKKINIDLDYATFFNDNPSNYINRFYDSNDSLTNETRIRVSKETPLDIWVGKVDYTQNIGESLVWEAGLKAAITTFDNDVLVEDFVQDEWIKAPFFSSEATMTENVGSAYSAFLYKLSEKTDVKAGIRYEFNDINLGTVDEPNIVDREKGRFFPSLFVSNKIDDNNSVQFSYSRRINRPSFKQLAPWFIFFDPSTVLTGNPTLQASISDAVRGTYSWKTVQFDLSYTYTNKPIGRFQPTVDKETNTQVNGSKNFTDGHLSAASISFPIQIADWWELRTSWTGQWAKVNDEVEGTPLSYTNSSWYMNGSSTIQLPKKFALEISGTYFSPSLFGAVVWEDFNTVDIGIQKEFNNNNGTLKFAVSDIFVGGNWEGNLDDPNIDFNYNVYYGFAERIYRLTYSKRFGNNKLKSERKRATGSAEEQQRVN